MRVYSNPGHNGSGDLLKTEDKVAISLFFRKKISQKHLFEKFKKIERSSEDLFSAFSMLKRCTLDLDPHLPFETNIRSVNWKVGDDFDERTRQVTSLWSLGSGDLFQRVDPIFNPNALNSCLSTEAKNFLDV